MKKNNFSYFKRKLIKAFWRFPLAVIFILLATVSSLIDFYDKSDNDIWTHLFLTSILAVPIFISINLYLERVETRRWFNVVINVVGFFILIIFFINLPYKYFFDKHFIRSLALFFSFLMSMFYLPFLGFHQQLPFWFYNFNFIKRILISFFYSSIFFIGILIALFAIWGLFEIETDKLITPLAIVLYVLFFPLMIISGLSPKFTHHADITYYPTYLKIIVQNILLPIITLYSLILIAYIIKIIVSGIWPSNWTTVLVLGYSSILLISIIIIHPVLFNNENKNLRKYIFIHLIASLIFIVIYFIAIIKRINEYGLTEHRVYAFIYGVWYSFIVIYFYVKKINDLRVIPFTLFIVLFLSVSGPWNIFRICKNNQLNRLKAIAKAENVLIDDKINAKNAIVKEKSVSEMSSIAFYLVSTHGVNSIRDLFAFDLDSLFKANLTNVYTFLDETFKFAGLKFNLRYFDNDSTQKIIQVFYTQSSNNIYEMGNNTYMCIFDYYKDTVAKSIEYRLNDTVIFKFQYIPSQVAFNIYHRDSEDAIMLLAPFYEYLKDSNKNVSDYTPCIANNLVAIAEGKNYQYKFYFDRIEFEVFKLKNIAKPLKLSGIIIIEPVKK